MKPASTSVVTFAVLSLIGTSCSKNLETTRPNYPPDASAGGSIYVW